MARTLDDVLTAKPRAALLPKLILRRLSELDRLRDDEADALDVTEIRARITACLGLDMLPLQPAVWRRLRATGVGDLVVELGTFEVVPGLPVPAHIHRPTGPGPHPAVAHAPGHWMENGRLEPDLQRLAVELARAGVLVLSFDPIGQGERRIGWHQHGELAPLLVGFTTLAAMTAEALGAVEVLAAREDVDGARVGVVGMSGGGLVSLLAAALDERVAAAAIACILNTHRGGFSDGALGTGWDGWVDLCNQIPRYAARLAVGAVLGAIAPRPAIVVHAVDDPPFPVEGARTVVAQAARRYARLGAVNRLVLHEVRGGHGFRPAARMATVQGLCAALALPPPVSALPEPELLPFAYVVSHDVARAGDGPRQSHIRADGRLASECLARPLDTGPALVAHARALAAGLRSRRVATLDGVGRFIRPQPPSLARAGVQVHVRLPDGTAAQRLCLPVELGVEIDAVVILPETFADDAPGVLIALDEGGKAQALASAGVAEARARGWAVIAPDLRGTGEGAASEFELATASWLCEHDLLADRVVDLRRVVVWCSERYSTGQQVDKSRIAVWAPGAFGLIALLAAVVDERIAGAASGPFVERLEELLVVGPDVTPMAFPFGALAAFDLPDLPRLAAPRPLVVGGPNADECGIVARLLDALDRA